MGINTIVEPPFYITGDRFIEVGENNLFGRFIRIEAISFFNGVSFSPRIIIGNNVVINPRTHIGAINYIQIKDNVLIGSNVLITDHLHGTTNIDDLKIQPNARKLVSRGGIIIEEDVWIGDNVVILSNVSIGRNSVIGANAVITKDVNPFSVVVGNNIVVKNQG